MPQGDRTGPNGQGPMTGRGRGFCSGFNGSGFANPGFGRGFGRGRCFGFRQDFVQPQVITEVQESEFLKQELEQINVEKAEIEARLKELKS